MIYYVDNINGNNDNDGSKNNPVLTIATGLNLLKASKEAGVIVLKESETPYILYNLATPMQIGYDVTIIGQKRPTVNLQHCLAVTSTSNNTMFVNLILQAADSGFTGDTRALMYINEWDRTYYKRFYNCLFQVNNGYPTAVFTYGANSGYGDTRIYYTNCTFMGKTLENATQHLNYCTYNVTMPTYLDISNSSNISSAIEGQGYEYYDNLKNDYPEYHEIIFPKQLLKQSIVNTILNNELIQKYVAMKEIEE